MEESLVFKREAQRIFTRLQIHIGRQLDQMAVQLDRISPLVIVEGFHASRLMEDESLIEISQAAHLISSGFGHAGNGDMKALVIIIGILLGSQLSESLVCGILLIDQEIMPIAGRIVSIGPMQSGQLSDLIVQIREVYISDKFDRVSITVYEVMPTQLQCTFEPVTAPAGYPAANPRRIL